MIVGKRALPALGIAPDGGALDAQMALLAEPGDMVIGFGAHPETRGRACAVARERGCLVGGPRDRTDQEQAETTYHVLWELVHVFFEHRGGGEGAGASSFLYPFLEPRETDVEAVVADVAQSMLMKADGGGGAARAHAGRQRGRSSTAAAAAARARPAAGCWRSATAARRPTRWTSSRTARAIGHAARSTSPRTRP